MALIECLATIQVIFTRYILSICLALGIIGSFFNLLIFHQKRLRSNSCSIYLIATSTFNLLVILCGMIPILLASYLSYDLASSSAVFCKAKSYITHILLMMSRSSVALACVDRYALCSRDVRIRSLSQRHVALISVITVSVLWLILPTHIIVFINIQMPGHRCGASGVYLIIYTVYAAIVIAIPLATMIIFSTLTIRSLRYTYTRVFPGIVNKDGCLNTQKRIQKRDIQLIPIVISEVIVYFLSTVWFPIYSTYLAITSNIAKPPDRVAIEGFTRYLILDFLIFLNSCSLFYIHLLASKRFREEFKQVRVRLFKRHQKTRVLKPEVQVPTIRINELELSKIRSIPDNL